MKTIFKYAIPAETRATVEIPYGGEILSIGEQDGRLWCWALVDPTNLVIQTHEFRIVGTGHDFEKAMASAGWGTDEDWGYFGGNEDF